MSNTQPPTNPSHEREQALFILAAAKPAAERAAFLDRECGTDKVLRAQLDALLAAHEAPEPIIDAPVPAPTIKVEFADAPDETIGQKIGRYKILERVGEGGCGVVYVAEQTEPVRRRVALKVIKLGMDTRQVVARFEAERQALAMMDHPNIAKVLDGGSTENGRPYFVMELVRGIRITDYCDQSNLATKDRLDLFIKVCQAIQHAHQKGIIHRDIKPSNILVTLHDGVPVPKVIDFGIAKTTEGRLTDATVYTQLQQFIGTPAYMSPEQAEMSGLDIDTRSDIYSLGVLLYELLTGKTPFDAQELMSQGIDAMRRTIREKEPAKPSTRLATLKGEELTNAAKRRSVESAKLARLLRGDLDWIVMKCLEKDRKRRYDTANGLALDLQRHLVNDVVVARPPTTAYLLSKLIGRNKLAFAAVGAVALALVLGIIATSWQAAVAKRARTGAEAVTRFLATVFQSPDPASRGRSVTVAESLDRAVTNLNSELAGQPLQKAKLQTVIGHTYASLGLPSAAIPLLEQARDYYLSTSRVEHPEALEAMQQLGISYFDAGRREEALKLREQVLELCRKFKGPASPETLDAMNNVAGSLAAAGRFDEAIRLWEGLYFLQRKVSGPEDGTALAAMNNLAYAYSATGRHDEAVKLREEAFRLHRKVYGPNDPNTLKVMLNLAHDYSNVGRHEEALKLREQTVESCRRVFGPEHHVTLTAMDNLAGSYFDTARNDEALKLWETVLKLRRSVLGPEHPDTLGSMHHLAFSYSRAGRREEALKLHEQVLDLSRRVNGPEHPETLAAMSSLAYSLETTGRREEAVKLREQFLDLSRKVNGPEHPGTIIAMHRLAISLSAVGRRDKAIKLHEEVVQLGRKARGPNHPDTLDAMNDLAWLLATCPEQNLRNGAAALGYGQAAVSGTGRKNASYLDTLAAAYAETGQFDQAVAVQKEAIALMADPAIKKELLARLKLYETNAPYREK